MVSILPVDSLPQLNLSTEQKFRHSSWRASWEFCWILTQDLITFSQSFCDNGIWHSLLCSQWCRFAAMSPRGGYSSSSRAGRLGRTLWPQNSTSVAETEKGGQNSTMTPPTLEKGVNILHQYEKSAKKGGKKSTILKNIGVKILQVWKWGSKFYMLKNRGQNSTMLEKRGSIFYIRPQK